MLHDMAKKEKPSRGVWVAGRGLTVQSFQVYLVLEFLVTTQGCRQGAVIIHLQLWLMRVTFDFSLPFSLLTTPFSAALRTQYFHTDRKEY